MKTFVRYISLLVFSGLIIPFYLITVPIKTACTQACSKPVSAIAGTSSIANDAGSYFYIDIITNIFPALKNLN